MRINENELKTNIDKVHTTKMGSDRIKNNLHLTTDDIVGWCKTIILNGNSVKSQKGKNWYIAFENYIITINAHSFTIITAHITQEDGNT